MTIGGDVGCENAATVDTSWLKIVATYNTVHLNCYIQAIKKGQNGVLKPYRVVPFVINIDPDCTPKIQKCRDSTCTTVDNYISGTRTNVATGIPLVQYFKLYLIDPPTRCYDDVNTKWTLSNNPAGDCLQTFTSSDIGR